MLLLTRFDGTQFYINADLVQTVEETPNTVITLTDHSKFMVKESAESVAEKYIQYQRKVNQVLQVEATLNS
jgi:flagellar protein FlbD